jgi:hypothetical protein
MMSTSVRIKSILFVLDEYSNNGELQFASNWMPHDLGPRRMKPCHAVRRNTSFEMSMNYFAIWANLSRLVFVLVGLTTPGL